MKITRLDPRSRQPTADVWSLSRDARRLLIGRAAPADILLDSPDISPRHAELSWQAGSLSILDLASINGIVLRDARVLRASLQDRDVFSVGGIPFLVSVEPADLAARRSRLLTLSGLFLGAVLVALLVLAFLRDSRSAAPEAPPQEPTPLLPASSDPAFQLKSDQFAQAADLLNESRRIIADGLDDLQAAQLLQQSLALNPDSSQAALLLKGLQEFHSASIQRQIDSLVSAGRFQDALDELDRQSPLVGAPDAIQRTQLMISQRIQFQDALSLLDQGDLDSAESILRSLPPDSIPELPDALSRLAHCRDAAAWAAQIDRLADADDLPAVQRLADDEPLHAPYLSPDALGEVHGAIARAHALADIQQLVAAGNTYILAQYLSDIPGLDDLLRPLRESLAPKADALRQTAATQAALASPSLLPDSLPDALASYRAACAYASLCILSPSPDSLRPFRLHSNRWTAYLAAVASRARAYVDQGAREEARSILHPLLPHLDPYDAAAFPLRSLSSRLAPIPFSPQTAHLLDKAPPAP